MSSLSVAYPETSIQEIVAAVIVRAIQANDADVELMTGESDSLWPLVKEGKIDIFATAWLPRDGHLIPEGYVPMGDLFTPHVLCCLNGERGGVTSLADIAEHPNDFEKDVIVMHSFRKEIEQILSAYSLDKKGFTPHILPDNKALDRMSELAQGDTPHLLPVLDPSYVIHGSALQILEDPKGAIPSPYKAVALVRKALLGEELQEIWDELDEMMITNKIVSIMDYAVHKEGMTPDAAADAWQRGKLIQR